MYSYTDEMILQLFTPLPVIYYLTHYPFLRLTVINSCKSFLNVLK